MDGRGGLLTLAAGWLRALSGPLCHPIVFLLQIQLAREGVEGLLHFRTCIDLSWLKQQNAGLCDPLGPCWWMVLRNAYKGRLKELRRILQAETDNPFAFLSLRPEELLHSSQMRLPKVTIIMPVKVVNEHSVDNWRSQIASVYGGELQFLFVVESEDDVAHGAVLQLMSAAKGDIPIELIVGGHAVKSSQKIHNQLAGVSAMSAGSKYILFLDDDIRLHPGTISQLVDTMEADQKRDSLKPNNYLSGIAALEQGVLHSAAQQCGSVYADGIPLRSSRTNLSQLLYPRISLTTVHRFLNRWSNHLRVGWMHDEDSVEQMLADDWRTDRYGICGALRDGGYSDDMILASVAGDSCSVANILGGCLDVSDPLFLWLAIFDRYSTTSPLHVYHKSLAIGVPCKYWNYLRRQIFVLETYSSLYNRVLNRVLFLVHCYLSWGLVIPFLVAELHMLRLGALYWSIYLGASNQLPRDLACTQGLRLSQALVLCLTLAFVSLFRMTVVVIKLCNKLSPERPHIPVRIFKWHLMLAGFLIGNTLYPVCALYTFIKPTVEWSGIMYTRYAGRVYKVQRQVPATQQNRTAAEQSTNSGLLSEAQAFVNQAVLFFAKVSPRFSKELKKSENP
eukprot:SM000063S20002  [mRNA]  locus=s63:263064:267377:+ [translate_table: standard]